jgi:hypothetical protein
MASRSKSKTTFAKLAREGRLRERRVEKQARKEARKRLAENPPPESGDALLGEDIDDDSASPVDDDASPVDDSASPVGDDGTPVDDAR